MKVWEIAVAFAILAAGAMAQTPPSAAVSAPAAIGQPHECKGYYPPDAAIEKREGRTMLGFTITPEGTVADPQVLRPSGFPDLDLAAKACARSWQYRPALKNGEKVAVPWKVYIVWVAAEPENPIAAAMRPVRADVWRCLRDSPAAKAVPSDAVLSLQIHVRFATWLSKTSVEIEQSSGFPDFDAAAVLCMRNSPHLPAVEAVKGDVPGLTSILPWWHTP